MAKVNNLQGKTGGRKGGKQFPNYSLKQVLPNLKELTSKTHSKPINMEQLNVGVFGVDAKSKKGKIRFSSLKQFSLAKGTYTALTATDLSTKLVLAEDTEKLQLIRQAFLNVSTFKDAFETFQASQTSKSRIKNYSVSSLKVHLDLSDKFVDVFLESAEIAQICRISGEEITFISTKDINDGIAEKGKKDTLDVDDELDEDIEDDDAIGEDNDDDDDEENIDDKNNGVQKRVKVVSTKPNIGIQLDASLDPDKLAKQLKLLRKYGLI